MYDLNAVLLNTTSALALTGNWIDLKGYPPYESIPILIRTTGGTGTPTVTIQWSTDGTTVDASAPTTAVVATAAGYENVIRPSLGGLPRGPYIRAITTAPATATTVLVGIVGADNV